MVADYDALFFLWQALIDAYRYLMENGDVASNHSLGRYDNAIGAVRQADIVPKLCLVRNLCVDGQQKEHRLTQYSEKRKKVSPPWICARTQDALSDKRTGR